MAKTKVSLNEIKNLRAKTKAGVMDCRKALEAAGGEMKAAEIWLREKGISRAEKRSHRETSQGFIEAYSHANGKIVAVVELLCESDFVAKTDEFQKLAHELAMQVAAMNPDGVEDFLKQNWIRDESKTIDSLVKDLSGKTGENIQVGQMARFELGGKD